MGTTFSEFTETMTLVMPDLGMRSHSFLESAQVSEHGLIVELAAIHAGLTANFNNYSAEALEAALDSWVNPYPKPIILNHDLMVDPLGRVMAAKMDKESDGTVYTRLQIAVSDPAAMARISDGRYLTGSVGGKSDEALCSICGKDWAEASMQSLPCNHQRGKTYKGSLAFLDRKKVSFKEYSFVNAPADDRSGIRKAAMDSTGADEWVRSARVFDLNMNKEEILEYVESEDLSVFSGMKKKESTPLYLQLKGAFLTALSAHEAELGMDSKESSDMGKQMDESAEVLDALDKLTNDLAEAAAPVEEDEAAATEGDDEAAVEDAAAEDEAAEEAVEDAVETADEEEADSDTEADSEPAEETTAEEDAEAAAGDEEVDEEAAADESGEEADKPQGQEGARADSPSNVGGTQRPGDKTRDSDESATNLQENEGSTALKAISVLERRVQELEDSEAALLAENTRLKKALHRTLVERVVDTKIALRLVTPDGRQEAIEEHMERNAGSLADSLRDLSKMSFEASRQEVVVPVIGSKGVALESGSNVRTVEIVEESNKDNTIDPEDFFTQVLMGKRKL